MPKFKLALLGSTGSIGRQTLEVVREFKGEVEVFCLSARRASGELLKQALEFRPKFVLTVERPKESFLNSLPKETKHLPFERESLEEVIALSDKVLNGVSSIYGLLPTYLTLKGGKLLLASNKESIICLPKLIRENVNRVIPVDSEHSSLFFLLKLVPREEVRRVYITASGGPFRTYPKEALNSVSPEEALNHPTWKMGKKITVDSATLMNKGFEVIEATVLFNLKLEEVEVVIHPQSKVHALLELKDSTYLMHMSETDMRIPIMNALFYPKRVPYPFKSPSPLEMGKLTFEDLDEEKFPSIALCREVAKKGGSYLPALVSADEEAVKLFLEGRISFYGIFKLIEEVLKRVSYQRDLDLEGTLEVFKEVKELVKELVGIIKG